MRRSGWYVASLVRARYVAFAVGSHVAADKWERHVRARTEAPDAVREAVPRRLRELGMTLVARGFKVIVDADRWCLTVVNKAAAPDDPSDPLAVAYGRSSSCRACISPSTTRAPCAGTGSGPVTRAASVQLAGTGEGGEQA
jgi:hypothetical protein